MPELLAGMPRRIPAMAGATGLGWALACLTGWAAGPLFALLWAPIIVAAIVLAMRRDAAPRDGGLLAALSADAVTFRFEASGEVGDVSESARGILRLAPELLLAGGLFERLHVADRVVFLCAMADMRHGAERRRAELRLRLPGTSPEAFGAFCLELLQTGDAKRPVLGLLRADDAARRVEAERDAAIAALNEARQAQARFMAALGHELRTPLNAVIGFSEMLESERLGGCTDPRQREYASLIRGCGAHLLRLADTMLDGGRLEIGGRTPEPEALDIAETAALARSMLALEAGQRGVRLVSRVEQGDPVRLDRRIVQQVLVNLLSNAVKFTPKGGVVALDAERKNGELRLSVSDTGPGMSEAELRAAGAAFARPERCGGGSEGAGIGLSLVRRLLAQHGGTLRLESRPGMGTVATAVFPLGPALRGSGALPATIATLDTGRTRDGATRKTA